MNNVQCVPLMEEDKLRVQAKFIINQDREEFQIKYKVTEII